MLPQLARRVAIERRHQLIIRRPQPSDRAQVRDTVLISVDIFGSVISLDALLLLRVLHLLYNGHLGRLQRAVAESEILALPRG